MLSSTRKEAVLGSLLALISWQPSQAQLIGNRGVVSLPGSFQYRDPGTVAAAQAVAAFAVHYQPLVNHKAAENRLLEAQKHHSAPAPDVGFFTWGSRPSIPGGSSDTLYYYQPPPTSTLSSASSSFDNVYNIGALRSFVPLFQ